MRVTIVLSACVCVRVSACIGRLTASLSVNAAAPIHHLAAEATRQQQQQTNFVRDFISSFGIHQISMMRKWSGAREICTNHWIDRRRRL